MGWLGAGEIIVILFLALVLFGPKQLPQLGKVIGSGLRELRKYSEGITNELESEEKEEAAEIPENLTPSPDIASENFDESAYPGNLEESHKEQTAEIKEDKEIDQKTGEE